MEFGSRMIYYKDLLHREPLVQGGSVILLQDTRDGKGGIRLHADETATGEFYFSASQGGRLLVKTSTGSGQSTHNSKKRAWDSFVSQLAKYAKG